MAILPFYAPWLVVALAIRPEDHFTESLRVGIRADTALQDPSSDPSSEGELLPDDKDPHSETMAHLAGVRRNGTGDMHVFIVGLLTNSAAITSLLIFFSIMRRYFPLVYCGNPIAGCLPDSLFGWIRSSIMLSLDEIAEEVGLDQAMLLEFTHFAMKLLIILAVPLCCVMAPMHCVMGGGNSGDDTLSWIGMANIVDDHWLYWVHAGMVWVVVVTVQRCTYDAQRRFVDRRVAWLQRMPIGRATTVLVMNIPAEQRGDDKLRKYIDHAFKERVVAEVHSIKFTGTLSTLVAEEAAHEAKLKELHYKLASSGKRPTFLDVTGSMMDTIDHYESKRQRAHQQAEVERRRISEAAHLGSQEVYSRNAFVTFTSRRAAELAMHCQFTRNSRHFVCEIPPDPADVIYEDLQSDPLWRNVTEAAGYAFVAMTYWAYLPGVVGIAYITKIDNLADKFAFFRPLAENPKFGNMWDAIVGSLLLTFVVSLIPTIFVNIYHTFFVLKAHAWLQHNIQKSYFWFQVVYVLLVTAIGSSIIATMQSVISNPLTMFSRLANTLPNVTHFYLNYLPIQAVTHAQGIMRWAQLSKFLFFGRFMSAMDAKEQAEPEDQDYYGLGSRNARHSFLLALVLVYCSLTPLILLLGIFNFMVSRIVYGYLVYFAETTKPDLGGVFWVTNLMNVQRCMLVYIVLMTGILYYRHHHIGPCLIAGFSAVVWYRSLSMFQKSFHWKSLCMEDFPFIDESAGPLAGDSHISYQQPELQWRRRPSYSPPEQ